MEEAHETKRKAKDVKKTVRINKDRFEVYGQYVASELREVNHEHSLLMAKYHINNILFEARMGKYKVLKPASPSAHSDGDDGASNVHNQDPIDIHEMSFKPLKIKSEGIDDDINLDQNIP